MTLFPFAQVRRYESFLGIRINPTESRQRPFHIAFLLDVSGSMEGERLDTVKRTLRLFANQMQPEDSASVITYSQEARVLCRGASSEELSSHVDELVADGGTNMEAGLVALTTSINLATVDAVFLLTDGEVNDGISSVNGLTTIARIMAYDTFKIPVYTLGYGLNHNSQLLQSMAVATRASYTFAESNEMIPSVVGSILVAMRDEVAKGVTIEWTGEAECCEAGVTPGAKTFCVGSVIANKPQWIVLSGSVESLSIHGMGMERCALVIPAEGEGEDEDVLEQWFRAEAVRVLTDALECGAVVGLPKLQALEDVIVVSPVAGRPLMLRIRGQIAEQRAHLNQPPPPPPPVYGGLMRYGHHGAIGAPPALTRFVSGVTAFATQRGDPDFSSPSQRAVSGAMVHHFHSGTTEASDITDPNSGNGDPDSLYP